MVYLRLPSESFFSSLFSHSHCSLDFDETAPSVAAAARCRGRHFPLMSAFQMPILCVILVKWRTVLSVGNSPLLWNMSVWLKTPFLDVSHTSVAHLSLVFL